MIREPYLKPDITSEILKPGALAEGGSSVGSDNGGGTGPGPVQVFFPLLGLCCN